MNYFELFEIPLQFEVDSKKIRPKFLELSRKFHPDFHTDQNEADQEKLMEISAAVNKGWQVFQEPLSTLHYVLELLGKITSHENPTLSPAFLMEMMELNELLTEGDPSQLSSMQEKISQYTIEIHEDVKDILRKVPATTTDKEFEKIKDYYYKSKYLQRIQERIGQGLS